MILKKQTNELLQILLEEGLDVNKFELSKVISHHYGETVVIHYKESPINQTPMHFIIYPGSVDNFDLFEVSYTTFSPKREMQHNQEKLSFDEVKSQFLLWINSHLKFFIENENELDYWRIIKENPLFIQNIDFTKDEPFRADEREQLRIGLEEIKTLLSNNLDLNENQKELTNKKIDYLIAATKRLNKTDWKGITISTLIAIAYDLSLDEQKRDMLFGLFSKLWAVAQHLHPRLL